MKVPKGKLLIIGGAESKGNKEDSELNMSSNNKEFDPLAILKNLKPKDGSSGIIEFITTASKIPEEMIDRYSDAFKKVGFKKVNLMHMDDKTEARNLEFVERIEKADTVFFSGGDQFRLSTIMGCTEIVSAMRKKYLDDSNFIIAGTSAGAMALTKIMIERGQTQEAMIKGDVTITSGLGILDNCIIDTHFIKRGRIGRLSQAIISNPGCVGIGLGEDTALLITKGHEMECFGSGMVMVIDCKDIGKTNIHYTEVGRPLYAENITMHILCHGISFNLKSRKFIITEEDQKNIKERAT